MTDIVLQWIGSGIIVAAAVGYCLYRLLRKKSPADHCAGCDLADHCRKNRCDKPDCNCN